MKTESRTDLQNTSFEVSRPIAEVTPSPKKKYPLLIGVAIIITLILAGILFFLNKNNMQKTITSSTKSELSGLSVVYGYTSFSTETQSWSNRQAFIANLTNTKRLPINPDVFANVISPSGRRFARVTKNTIETAIGKDPTTFKKIVDISDRNDALDIGYVTWSKDESQLAYHLFILKKGGAETQYYSINYNGSGLHMIGNISDYPGGHFLGYDFDRKLVYATKNDLSHGQETLIALNSYTNESTDLLVLPVGTDILLSSGYIKAYYSNKDGKLTEFNLVSKVEKVLTQVMYVHPRVYISPNDKLLLISAVSSDGIGSDKLILDKETGSLDLSLNDPAYRTLSFYPGYSFSPDSRFLFLSSRKKTIQPSDPKKASAGEGSFYSGNNCIWDIAKKKIVPFFNCNIGPSGFIEDKINEAIGFMGWLQNSEELTLNNNQIPSPTPTIKKIPSDNKIDLYVQTRNVKRESDVSNLIKAVEAYVKENKSIPQGITSTVKPIAKTGADICFTLVPQFVGAIPQDPNNIYNRNNKYASGGSVTDCNSDYDTGYTIVYENGRIIVSAPLTEQTATISGILSLPSAE